MSPIWNETSMSVAVMNQAKYNGMNGTKYLHVLKEKLKLHMSVQKLKLHVPVQESLFKRKSIASWASLEIVLP